MRRDLRFERDVTHQAAKGVCDPSSLITHAEARAARLYGDYVVDWMSIAPGRDLLREAREEAADARNYLVFWLQEHQIADEESLDSVKIALRFFVLAYHHLMLAQEAA